MSNIQCSTFVAVAYVVSHATGAALNSYYTANIIKSCVTQWKVLSWP